MGHLPQLITDLALILICAGIMTLLFKKLKQPVVLGYIVAGFLASPYMPYTPSVVDHADISTWADIGVIFLLFSLGLEFSFKKLLKIGSTPIIAVATSLTGMISIGILVALCFGWSFMNGLYLGGMMAIASTSIIVKAFDELGLRQQKFASLVFSVLILEDIIAIVMMLLFGTLGKGGGVDAIELLKSIAFMVFYLVLWFVLGIYLVPTLLKKARPLLTGETLLIASLSFCFLMVVLASLAGFSPAFGAFVMGSILSETIEGERIARLVTPIKDLFGAVFFVSVGMMINPAMLLRYWMPIVIITLVVLVLRSLVETFAFLLGGVDLRTSLRCGFSLAQVGEFAFIIATLGISLGAISDFMYPIIVSVSVITTFTTPYMIRLAPVVGDWLEPRLPKRIREFITRYDAGGSSVHTEGKWRHVLTDMLSPILIYGVLSIAIVVLSSKFLLPTALSLLPPPWARLTTLVVTLAILTLFLRPLLLKHCFTNTFWELWNDRHFNRAPLLAIVLLRMTAVIALIVAVVSRCYPASVALAVGVVAVMLVCLLFSRRLKTRQQKMENTFMQSLNQRELAAAAARPRYAGELQSRDIHLTDVEVPPFAPWCGQTLRQLAWSQRYDIQIVSIMRDGQRINVPPADTQLFPHDHLQLLGNDACLNRFVEAVTKASAEEPAAPTPTTTATKDAQPEEMSLQQIAVTAGSPLIGRSVLDSGIRTEHRCLIVGIDRPSALSASDNTALLKPTPDLQFVEGDIVWLVGENAAVRALLGVVR